MPLTVECPGCSKTLRVPDNLAGKRGKCPSCGGFLDIPGEHDPVMPPAAAYSAQPPVAPPRPTPAQGFTDYGRGGADLDFSYQSSRPRGTLVAPATFGKLFWCGFALTLLGFVTIIGFAVAAGIMDESRNRSSFQTVSYDPNRPYRPTPAPSASSDLMSGIGLLGLLLGVLAILAGLVLDYIFLYKCWDLIQDGRARTSPGKAVGFMFIPFFNLYWMFVAFRGLAEDLNLYSRRYNLQAREAPVGLITAGLILYLCGLIPFVGGCIQLIGMIIMFVGMLMVKSTAQDIAEARMTAA